MGVWKRYGLVFVLLIFWNVICAEETEGEFEMMDGIKVSKDSILNETSEVNRKGKEKDSEENGDDNDDHDDYDEEDDDDDDDDDGIDDDDEDLESTKHLPTKCHVCRLLAVEVENKLTYTGRIRKHRENKSPIYYKEEVVMLRVTEDLCDVMQKYNIRPKLPFRYKRGVKSFYRKQIEDLTKDSRIKKWMFATPEEDIDDPTGEIRRLKKQCHGMLVETQKLLINWFMKAQSRDLTRWLCKKRVLIEDDQDCLDVEMPRRNKVPSLRQKNPKTQDHENETRTLPHEEL